MTTVASNNFLIEDAPVGDSNQIIERDGKQYFYEEITINAETPNPEDGKYFITDIVGTGISKEPSVTFIKVGRMVTMMMDPIQNPIQNPVQVMTNKNRV